MTWNAIWSGIVGIFRRRVMGLPDANPAVNEANAYWRDNAPEFSWAVRMALLGDEEGEDAFRVVLVGDHGLAFGPFQHHWKPRGRVMFEGCGIDIRTAGQVDCLRAAHWEMQHVEHASYHALVACTDIDEAVRIMVHLYERSASQATDIVKRTAYAKKWAGIFLAEYVAPDAVPTASVTTRIRRVGHNAITVRTGQSRMAA